MSDLLARLADRLDPHPVEIDVFAELGYEPNCKVRWQGAQRGEVVELCGQCPQEQFHAATEFYVLYGGAAAGGKTKGLLFEGLRACVRHPGIVALAIRESYPELAESFIAELGRIDYAKALAASYNKGDHNLSFANGSVIRFRHCDSLADAELRLGSEIQLLLVDEATKQKPEALNFLATRLRTSNPRIPVLGVRLASNPGGIGHGSIRRRYVDATHRGAHTYPEVVDGVTTGHEIRFIQARYTDNPHVPNYEAQLNAIPDPRLRSALRDGSWTTFDGQVFVEWNADRHIIAPFKIPPEWRRYAGIDYGYAAPWSVQWIAQDADRRAYVYRELHDTGVVEEDQARRILAAEGNLTDDDLARVRNENVTRFLDPSCWAKRHDVANSIAHVYAMNGVHCAPASNDRVPGWTRVHSFLAEGPACRAHRALGWVTCPLLHVFDTCTNLIRTLPDLPADKHNPEDVDTDADDHDADALRYGLMPLALPYRSLEALPPEPSTPEERVRADVKAKREARKRRGSEGMAGRY